MDFYYNRIEDPITVEGGRPMRRKRRFLYGIIVLLVSLLFINVIAGMFFYNLAIKRGPKEFLQGNEDLEVSAETLEEFLEGDWIAWTKEQPFEQIEMTAYDGLRLQGYYLAAKEPTNKTVLFAHGYLGNAFDMGLFGHYYYEQLGYN